jgi:hypothetical protein
VAAQGKQTERDGDVPGARKVDVCFHH